MKDLDGLFLTHNEKRVGCVREGLLGLVTGAVYGITSVIVGQPFDTIKTKMQVVHEYQHVRAIQACRKLFAEEGIRGYYRGSLPRFVGYMYYRAVQFAVFEFAYTHFKSYSIISSPVFFGIEPRVPIAGFISGIARTVVESPLEYIKVRRQAGLPWKPSGLMTGFGETAVRTCAMLTAYFSLLDFGKRTFPGVEGKPIVGSFIMSGVCSTIGWALIWPLENIKNQVQGQLGGSRMSYFSRFMKVYQRGGLPLLYRGFIPGAMRGFVSHGASMVVMILAQKKATDLGLRSEHEIIVSRERIETDVLLRKGTRSESVSRKRREPWKPRSTPKTEELYLVPREGMQQPTVPKRRRIGRQFNCENYDDVSKSNKLNAPTRAADDDH